MKKIILLIAAIMAFVPAVSFAGSNGETGAIELGDTDILEVSTSNQVYIEYNGLDGGATYAIATYHDKGDRTYMSSSEDATIYWGDEIDLAAPDAPAEVGSSIGKTTDFDKTL